MGLLHPTYRGPITPFITQFACHSDVYKSMDFGNWLWRDAVKDFKDRNHLQVDKQHLWSCGYNIEKKQQRQQLVFPLRNRWKKQTDAAKRAKLRKKKGFEQSIFQRMCRWSLRAELLTWMVFMVWFQGPSTPPLILHVCEQKPIIYSPNKHSSKRSYQWPGHV